MDLTVYLHTPRSSTNGMNHTCICLPSRSWYSFTNPGGMEGWVGLGQKLSSTRGGSLCVVCGHAFLSLDFVL